MKLTAAGKSREEITARLKKIVAADADWRGGKTFSLVYFAGDETLDVAREATDTFFMANALSPVAFPSLKRFESEVVAMAADLLNGDEAVGNMTTGGTESILMAVKAARDWARRERPGVGTPEMLLPASAHPAFDKAAHYFDVVARRVPVGDDFRADAAATAAAMTEQTILVVGSAPSYPHGVIDPIRDLAAIARDHGVLCHVDACVGGFLLPFLRCLGRPVPDFDFSVPGVTSISADLHKYGFGARGASIVLYRDRALRRHQFFASTDWSGGLYGSPTMTGSRAGGPIAAAWAVMNHLGADGYLRLARITIETAERLMAGVRTTPGLRILGRPDMSVFAFTADAFDIYALGEAMEARGWRLDRQQRPACLHVVVTPAHAAAADAFIEDLRASAREVESSPPDAHPAAAMYGMLGTIPDRGAVESFILEFLDGVVDRVDEPSGDT